MIALAFRDEKRAKPKPGRINPVTINAKDVLYYSQKIMCHNFLIKDKCKLIIERCQFFYEDNAYKSQFQTFNS